MSKRPDASCDFMSEDFAFTADLLRRYSGGKGPATRGNPELSAMFRAVCSNYLAIILAALDAAAERKP